MTGPHRVRRRAIALASASALGVLALGGAALVVSADPHRGTTPKVAFPAPRFVDVTATSGVVHRYDGEPPFEVGGGVAAFDCNADGLPDLYLAGGSGPAALERNVTRPGGPIAFERVGSPVTDLTGVNGAYPLDVDGDGNVDLAVLRVGETVLLRGLGDCAFERGNEHWGFDAGRNEDTTAFAATWEGEGSRGATTLPTLAVGRYLALDSTGTSTFDCATNLLLRPDPSGVRYAPGRPLAPGYCTLAALFSDWSRSGRRDLRLTNDRHYYLKGSDQLWRVEARAEPRAFTSGDGWVRMTIWGMGIASADLTGDGYPEVYLTSQGDNKLQTLTAGPSQPRFRDIALRLGANAARPLVGGDVRPSTAWHPEFADVNADGFLDLFVSKGNVSAQADYAAVDPSELLLGGPDGRFRPAAAEAGIVGPYLGRGAALVDLDLDGLLDLVENPYRDPVLIRRNVGSGSAQMAAQMGHWVQLRLRQPGANRDAIGAWVEVRIGERTLLRELTVGGGHAGGQLGWIPFGLGPSVEASIRVTWPDGERSGWLGVPADRFFVISRGEAPPAVWSPGEPAP